ncbi:hypothetical protein RNJ44_00193 [Nakaseomyces bracarensis]|uniref:Major facilitator superfamily (MFS) profile domain-containing protein n=1 Tax=Nakaseomyces bracarensis TaxID=273131 RepID=A0ABR4NT64_9SACH
MINLAAVAIKHNVLTNKLSKNKHGSVVEGSSHDIPLGTIENNDSEAPNEIVLDVEQDITLKNLRPLDDNGNAHDLGLVSNSGFQMERHGEELNDFNKKFLGDLTTVTQESKSSLEEDTPDDIWALDNDKEFPDGGLRAWSVVFGSFMGLIPVFGVINSLGAIESYISTHQLMKVSSSTVSWIFSIYLTISFFSCILAGGYFDRNGSTNLMILGTLFYVGGIFGLADCKEIYQFILSFSILCGAGTGILMTALVSSVATWFLRKRAIATSVATTGGSVGGIIFPIMLRKLYVEIGFQWAIRVLAFICLACLICSIVFTREKSKPITEPFESKTALIKWYMASSFNISYFLDMKFVFVTLGASLAESSLTTAATYLASYSISRGNSENVAYTMLTAYNAAGILGRYIPGYVADKYLGRFNVMIITIAISALLCLVVWLPFGGHPAALWTFACLYGFFTGSILSLTPVCIGQISRTVDFGKRYATAYFVEALFNIPMLPIGGAIIGARNVENYNHFIIYVAVLMAAGSLCYAISRVLCVGFHFKKF